MKTKLLRKLRKHYFIKTMPGYCNVDFILIKKDYSEKTFIKSKSSHSRWIDFFEHDFILTTQFSRSRKIRENKKILFKLP